MSHLQFEVNSMIFPGGPDLIKDFGLSLEQGEFISFLGKSGSGKSTLLRIVAGLETRFCGKVELDNHEVKKPSQKIQMVFQDYRLLPWKSVRENLDFAVNGGPLNARDSVERWLGGTGLGAHATKMPKQLSGGEKSRAAFARALVNPPTVLLLDEPFSALDPETRFDLQDTLIEALASRTISVIMISHSIRDAVFLSDKVHLLGCNPLNIQRTFAVPKPRPRDRNDADLIGIANEIARTLRPTIDSAGD
jgi:sulfonate transport system ATP-binding protein